MLAQCSRGCHVIERFAHFLGSIHKRVALSLMFLTHLKLSQCVYYSIQSVDKVTHLMKNSVLLPGLSNLRQKFNILLMKRKIDSMVEQKEHCEGG